MGKKSVRPRFDEELFEVLDEERDNPNQGIDEVLKDMFPELEDMVEDNNSNNRQKDELNIEDLF